jgi:endonuclease/exonuclease/phosphatase family metal-dependent hydrolase
MENRLKRLRSFRLRTGFWFPLLAVIATHSGFDFTRPTASVESTDRAASLSILAYNIRHGAGNDDIVDLSRAAGVINALDPDIVALQEVDSAVERTDGVDQATVLGKLTGMGSVFGAFFDYQGGRYGMAILSDLPIVSYENHRLPDGLEPRTALAARIRLSEPSQEIIVVGIHFYATAEERYAQASRLIEILREETAPIILAGDFNSTPESEVIDLFKQAGWHVPDKGEDRLTFRSDSPVREIDYIMVRPKERFEIDVLDVIDEPLVSDHRPVLLQLRLIEKAQHE